MPFHFQGKTFDAVPRVKMTPGEIDEVERITGVTYKRIAFMSSRCVCEHIAQAHLHYGEDGHLSEDDETCGEKGCGCVAFAPNLPALVEYAFLYVAAKRNDPSVTWDSIRDLPQDSWQYERDADPTEDSDEARPTAE